MTSPLTISRKDPDIPDYLDFNKFREKGIEHLAELSGKIWTDHNLHDPGITILEVLCYALVDLGYRNTLKPEELLAPAADAEEDNFFTPAEILGSNPLTILDYRKLLIDIKGVRNAWLEPAGEQEVKLYAPKDGPGAGALQYLTPQTGDPEEQEVILNGLYRIYLELDETGSNANDADACSADGAGQGAVLEEVVQKFNQFRNLCEDVLEVIVLKDEQLGLCTDIELKPEADPEDVLVEILSRIQEFLSPSLKFYTLQEMLENGKAIEEIFEGRPLTSDSHGFVDPEGLAKLERRKELYASDLYRVIMDIPEVVAVKGLQLSSYIDGECQRAGEEWCLPLTDNYRPVLAPELSTFTFHKGVLQFQADPREVSEQFKKRLAGLEKAKLPPHKLDLEIPYGKHRGELGDYLSVQHDFPLTYRIGSGEMPDNASPARKAQALQLKGYLLFYDQLLANYLAQLAHVRDLFSLRADPQREESRRHSYFAREVDTVPEIEKLLLFYRGRQKNGSPEGNVLARSPESLNIRTAERRDAILRDVQEAFGHNEVQAVVQGSEEGYRFSVQTNTRQPVLVSTEVYATEAAAQETANLILFLGAISGNYREVYDRATGSFGFELLNNPGSYLEYLQELVESEEEYLRRRDRFLNHLLARFSEDFTDYVLLMYALYGGRPPQGRIVEDKANLLSRYDEISRDRSRAYNYRDQEGLWNTENVSGLEKRVSGLIGIKDFSRNTLSHFEITRRESLYYLQLDGLDRQPLFVTSNPWESAGRAEQEKENLIAYASEWANYRGYDCPADGVYGFELLDRQGQVFATHPLTYGSAQLRDDKMRCTQLLVRDAGLMHRVVASEEEYYFFLYDDSPERNLLFISSQSFPSREEAWAGWHRFAEVLADETNERKFFIDDFQGERFTIVVRDKKGGRLWEDLARYADDLDYDTTEPLDAMRDVVSRIPQKQLFYSFYQLPTLYNWQINDEDGNLLLQSTFLYQREERAHVYKDIGQAAESFLLFMDHAVNRLRYYIEVDDAGYFFSVLNEDANQVARSVYFDTFQACEDAVEAMIAFLEPIRERVHQRQRPNLANYLRRVTKRIKFLSWEGLYSFYIEYPQGKAALHSVREFTTLPEAYEAFYQLLETACDPDNYVDITSEDGCLLGFELRQEGELLAVHPDFYLYDRPEDIPVAPEPDPPEDTAEGGSGEEEQSGEEETPEPEPPPTRQEVKEALRDHICSNQYAFDISGKWRFEILCEDCEAVAVRTDGDAGAPAPCCVETGCRPLLYGVEAYNTPAEAEAAYMDFRTALLDKEAAYLDDNAYAGAGPYGFVVKLEAGGDPYASSFPLLTSEEKERVEGQSRQCLEKFWDYYTGVPVPLGLQPQVASQRERMEVHEEKQQYIFSIKGDLQGGAGLETILEGVKFYPSHKAFNAEFLAAALDPENYFLIRSSTQGTDFPVPYFSYGLRKGEEVLGVIPGHGTAEEAWEKYQAVFNFISSNQEALRCGGFWKFQVLIVQKDGEVKKAIPMEGLGVNNPFNSRSGAEEGFKAILLDYMQALAAGKFDDPAFDDPIKKLWGAWNEVDNEERENTYLKAEYLNEGELIIRQDSGACRLPNTWGFELWWPGKDKAAEPGSSPAEPFLLSPPDTVYSDPAEAEAALDKLMGLIEAGSGYELASTKKVAGGQTSYSFLFKSGGEALAAHHTDYSDITLRDEILQLARDHFLPLLPSNPNRQGFRLVRLQVPPIDAPGTPEPVRERLAPRDCSFFSGFRLIKDEEVLARHPHTYSSPAARDSAASLLFSKVQQQLPPYLPLAVFCRSRRGTDSLYYLVVRKEEQALWWGLQAYQDKAEADAACPAGHIAIMHAARRYSAYRVENGVIVLRDQSGQPLARVPETSQDTGRQQELIRERIREAWAFPLFRDEEGFGFRTHDTGGARAVEWEGIERYASYEAVREAYHDFLAQLQYQPNYRKRNDAHTGNYRLELGQVMLESGHVFREDAPARLRAWEWCFGVKSLLQSAQKDSSYYRYVDYENGCNWSFRIADENYRVAVHPRQYHTLADRECKRDLLYEWASCQESLYSTVAVGTCVMDGNYHFIIKAGNIPNAKLAPCEAGEVLWRSYASYPSKDAAEKAGEALVVQLMNNAREPDFYVLSEADNHRYTAALADNRGDFLAVIPTIKEEFEDLLALVVRHGRVESALGVDRGDRNDADSVGGGLVVLTVGRSHVDDAGAVLGRDEITPQHLKSVVGFGEIGKRRQIAQPDQLLAGVTADDLRILPQFAHIRAESCASNHQPPAVERASALHGDVIHFGIDGHRLVGRQSPRRGGPDQQIRAVQIGLGGAETETDGDGRILSALIDVVVHA